MKLKDITSHKFVIVLEARPNPYPQPMLSSIGYSYPQDSEWEIGDAEVINEGRDFVSVSKKIAFGWDWEGLVADAKEYLAGDIMYEKMKTSCAYEWIKFRAEDEWYGERWFFVIIPENWL